MQLCIVLLFMICNMFIILYTRQKASSSQFLSYETVSSKSHSKEKTVKDYNVIAKEVNEMACQLTAVSIMILQWRHNGCDGISNHRGLHCLLNCWVRRRSKKTLKLRVIGLCEGNSPVTGEFPAQRASNAENVSIWWRHHDIFLNTWGMLFIGQCFGKRWHNTLKIDTTLWHARYLTNSVSVSISADSLLDFEISIAW